MLDKLRSLLTKRDKQFLLGLLFFSILISVIETVGISVIMPFMSIAIDFNLIHENEYYSYFYKLLSFKSEISFILFFGISLVFFYLFRSLINIFYFYLLSKFTQGRYHLLAYRLFENYMNMPYQKFTTKNSSTLNKTIINEASYLTLLLSSLLLMMSEIFIVIFIYGMMLYVDFKITLFLTIVLFFNAFIMIKTISVKIKKMGVIRAEFQKKFYETINKSFGNFKLIKLQENKEDMLDEFGKSSFAYAEANITYSTMVQVPRLFLEAIAFSIIVSIITYLVWKYESNVSGMLAVVSMFVLALYRLMPSINRIMSSYNSILFYHKSLDIIYNDLSYQHENLGSKKILFKNKIVIKNLDFEYEKDKPILKNINLIIEKGSKIGFIGESGSGKSTLVDTIIGLYEPKKGEIFLDTMLLDSENIQSWRSKVGYIPQSVYLFDGTVGENVAFGLKYNSKKIDKVLKQAKIYDFLENKDGQETLVGEAGVMLSGGQKQRVAIARALYSNPEILVLDEATSALDNETESAIMDAIYDISKDKTLLIIAHRLSTLDRCDKIYKLVNGEIL